MLKKTTLLFLGVCLSTYVLLLLLHLFVLTNTKYLDVNHIFLFHSMVTIVILVQLYFINKKLPDQLGFVFLGMITLKMVLVAFYIAPHLTDKVHYTNHDLALFSLPYFIFLTFEVYVTKLLLDKKLT